MSTKLCFAIASENPKQSFFCKRVPKRSLGTRGMRFIASNASSTLHQPQALRAALGHALNEIARFEIELDGGDVPHDRALEAAGESVLHCFRKLSESHSRMRAQRGNDCRAYRLILRFSDAHGLFVFVGMQSQDFFFHAQTFFFASITPRLRASAR